MTISLSPVQEDQCPPGFGRGGRDVESLLQTVLMTMLLTLYFRVYERFSPPSHMAFYQMVSFLTVMLDLKTEIIVDFASY